MNPVLALIIVLSVCTAPTVWITLSLHDQGASLGRLVSKAGIYPALAAAYMVAAPLLHPGLYG